MNLDDEGNPTYGISETMRTSATLPVVHNTTKPQNLDVKDIGSHSVTVSWDAPAEGFTREYEVDLAGHKRIVRAEEARRTMRRRSTIWAVLFPMTACT